MSVQEAHRRGNELFSTLTGGLRLLKSNPHYASIISRIRVEDYLGAAAIITTHADEFLNNVVASLPTPMNREGVNTNPPNELSAMFLVVARDNMRFSDLLTRNFTAHDEIQPVRYAPDDSRCNGSPSYCNSEHYIRTFDGNAKKSLKVIERSGSPGPGIMASYGWAISNDFMGTQRRNVKAVITDLFCSDMNAFRTRLIPDVAIRRDVDRSDPLFSKDCKTCHSWTDDWTRAFLPKTVTTAAAPPAFCLI